MKISLKCFSLNLKTGTESHLYCVFVQLLSSVCVRQIKLLCLIAIFFLASPLLLASEKISELKLDNGLKIIVKPDRRSPVAMLQVWYRVGASYEQEGATGVSHMLEHLMFKGAENYSLQLAFKQLNNIGARANAYTHRDYTFYYHMLAKEHLETAFLVEAHRMQTIKPMQQDFDIEKKVILEELHMHNTRDPHLAAYEMLYRQSFTYSGYRLPVIGYSEDIRNMTMADTLKWYDQYYTPDNATIVVTGDVDTRQIFKLARKYFSSIRKASAVKQRDKAEPLQDKEIRYVMPETTAVGLLLQGYKVPSIVTAQPKWEAYALDVLAGWFESGHHSRLSKSLIRVHQNAYEIKVIYSLMKRQDTLFIIEAIPSEGGYIDKLEQVLNAEIEHIKDELISEKNLKKIKNQMISTEIYERDSLYTQAKIIGQAEAIGIPWQEDAQYIKRIKAVTPEQIRTVLRKYFVPANKVSVIQYPDNNN